MRKRIATLVVITFLFFIGSLTAQEIPIVQEKLVQRELVRLYSFAKDLPSCIGKDTVFINNSKTWIYSYRFDDSISFILQKSAKELNVYVNMACKEFGEFNYWSIQMKSPLSVTGTLNYNDLSKIIENCKIKFYNNVSFKYNEVLNDPAYFNKYLDEELIFEGNIAKSHLDGTCTFFYTNGEGIMSTGSYLDGKKDGLWQYYYSDDFKFKVGYTIYKKWDEQATRLYQAGVFKQDEKEGKWVEVNYLNLTEGTSNTFLFGMNFEHKYEQVIYKGTYKNGSKEGVWEYVTGEKKIIVSGNYKNNLKTGTWNYFNLYNQQISLIAKFKGNNPKDTLYFTTFNSKEEDLDWEEKEGSFVPLFIEGDFTGKIVKEDASYSIVKVKFENYKNQTYSIEKAGSEFFYDVYNSLVKTLYKYDSSETVTKTTIVMPKVNGFEYTGYNCSGNRRYFAGINEKYFELWDLKKNYLITSFEHKIKKEVSSNQLSVEFISDDGKVAEVTNGYERYYKINCINKSIETSFSDYSDFRRSSPTLEDKKSKFYQPDSLTLSSNFFNQQKRGMEKKIFRIALSSLGNKVNIDKIYKYGFDKLQGDRYLSFFDNENLFIYDLQNGKTLNVFKLPDDFVNEASLIDSVTFFYYSSPNLIKYNVITGERALINTQISIAKLIGLEWQDNILYTLVSSNEYTNLRGSTINPGNGTILKYEYNDFKKRILPAKSSVHNGIRTNGLRINLAKELADSVAYTSPLKTYMYGRSNLIFMTKKGLKEKLFLTVNEDNELLFYNPHKSKAVEKVVNLIQFSNDSYIFFCPDQYYLASKNAGSVIKFEKGLEQFSFEQFDLKYNRPDIVLERMGYADSLTIYTYHKAYLKRLKKMNFSEDMLKEDFHLPEIKIENFENMPSVTDSAFMEINLHLNDSKYKLDRMNIYLNDVPVYGTTGIDLRIENCMSLTKKINLGLIPGRNDILVSVLNQAGAESYKASVSIIYKPKTEHKSDLYLVTIGDSKYKDSRYDLTYASKDAEDIRNAFNGNVLFGNVFTYIYTNENVTKENILKLKATLSNAKTNDVVIITVAGHGVLDKNLDYYLATYNMDFNNPVEKGLPYEELESLVDGIAPLRKVIFLDACHSGEVDKEEVEQLAVNTVNNNEVKFRAAGAGIQKKNLGLKTTSELMGELFTDLRRGTGATVISSAGGAEYAMESDTWKNGLFTYCLLHGLKDRAADMNADGQVMLSELQHYLRAEVTRLSNGAQQPTSRIENLSMDFRVW